GFLLSIAAVLNAILDPILIFGWGPFPRLEVAGAAWATVISGGVAAAAVIWVVIVREKMLAPEPPSLAAFVRQSAEILKVGVPAMASNMLNPLALALVVASVARFGPGVVAGYGAASRVENFAAIPMLAVAVGLGPVVGQNTGAGFTHRVREGFRA